ncbi:Uncharacterised protein [Serratia grimesii]|nr:Uncharacterised protein [Serratia grimesii]CAI1532073.1 Uncharacterised protein [Serratia grimesii]
MGVPTSLYGLQWVEFKVLKQQVDCITDVTDAMTGLLSKVKQGAIGQELDNINSDLLTCTKGINVRKGSIEFAVEQYKRYQ